MIKLNNSITKEKIIRQEIPSYITNHIIDNTMITDNTIIGLDKMIALSRHMFTLCVSYTY